MSNKKINVILRGHIRNSFENKNLYYLMKKITKDFDTNIYIHTWNIVQNNLSWRHMDCNNTKVDEEFLKNYFEDIWYNVKYCMIEDEKIIPLHGNTEGLIGSTPCPIKGYKNMIYGIYRISEYLFFNTAITETVVQTRFDILTNPFSHSVPEARYLADPKTIMKFLHNPTETEDRIKFIEQRPMMGIDNTYMASVNDLYEFIKFFYYNLDEIIYKYKDIKHQEYLPFFERNNF